MPSALASFTRTALVVRYVARMTDLQVPASGDELDDAKNAQAAAEFAARLGGHGNVLLLTGAGLSTASGIGDYRDREGNYKRPPPVTISRFLASAAARQRYWARSAFGWPSFNAAVPNQAHRALAILEQQLGGFAAITQNVDELHQRAGHQRVIELHGSLRQVACVGCDFAQPRQDFQDQLLSLNPQLLGARGALAPDGDADLLDADYASILVPDCPTCGALLKPTVVFFGDAVARSVVAAAFDMVAAADALLIVGSSVMIHSSFRFCRRAQELGVPIYAVNQGRTRADDWLAAKYDTPCEVLLPLLCQALTGNDTGEADG